LEHEPLILLLDLILLKPRVFLHLLFNRGSPPFDATSLKTVQKDVERGGRIRRDVGVLLATVIVAETLVRVLSQAHGTQLRTFAGVLGIVTAETVSQHAITLGFTLVVLRWREWYPMKGQPSPVTNDGRQRDFMYVYPADLYLMLICSPSLIPLVVLYTSLVPLVLQLFLSIWYTSPTATIPTSYTSLVDGIPFDIRLYPKMRHALIELEELWHRADSVWAGTRLLGGMSAGFGLRVLLPTKPWETTGIVLAGWGGAALARRAVESMFIC